MPKKPTNSGKPWTPASNKQLITLINGNTPTRVIALKLKRTPAAIQSHAGEIGASLKPTNQRPYNRRPR